MDLKDKVIKSLCDIKDFEESNYETYIEKLKDKKSEEIIEELLTLPREEDGGRIAITGFYYQFLVFLDYWLQMLNGDWDYVALELHEDIVVGKGNKLRFIQVKSSKETELRASQTLKKRSVVKEGGEVKAVINNSWIDKLLIKARDFKKTDGYETEFELITSFVVLNSNTFNIGNFKTKKYPIDINDGDDLVKFMSKELHDRDGNRINYEHECDEPIIDLLSRFHIIKKHDLDSIEYYENHILMSLSNYLGEGAKLTQEDLMMLVGRLMKMCSLYQDKLTLYISAEESEQILQTLDDKAARRAEVHAQFKGSYTILDEVFANLTSQLSSMDLYDDISKYVKQYREYLDDWMKKGGTVRQLINRYLDGNEYSVVYKTENSDEQKIRLFEFFSVNLLLILAHNDISKFSKHYKSLLVKEINNKFVAFLSMNRGDHLDKAIEKAKYLLNNFEDIKQILSPPKTIIQGNFINNRRPVIKRELFNEGIKDVNITEIPEGLDLDKVNPVLYIIPGGRLQDEFNNLFGYAEFEELKVHLNTMWEELIK